MRPSELDVARAEYAYTDGVRKVGNGDTQGARAAFLRAVKLNPTHSMAWNDLGYLRETKEKDMNSALLAYQSGRMRFTSDRLTSSLWAADRFLAVAFTSTFV
jgi:hypothetical protein